MARRSSLSNPNTILTMTKKEYIAPAIMVIEMQAEENMLALSFNDNGYEGPEMSKKREPNSIWGTSDGISSMGNTSK